MAQPATPNERRPLIGQADANVEEPSRWRAIGKAVMVATVAISGVAAVNYGSKSIVSLVSSGGHSTESSKEPGQDTKTIPGVTSYEAETYSDVEDSYSAPKTVQTTDPWLTAESEYGAVDAQYYPWVGGRKIVEPYLHELNRE